MTTLTAAVWPANDQLIVALFYPAVFVAALYRNRNPAVASAL
ncbi:MAG: hypothetical protein ABIX28_07810 [Vicinamibacterales bacterium]